MKKLILSLIVCAFANSIHAQYTVYPIPQQQVAGSEKVSLSENINVVYESKIDTYTKNRLTNILKEAGLAATTSSAGVAGKTNIYIGVNGSGEVVDKLATERGLKRDVFSKSDKFDRHLVSLSKQNEEAELVILGENTDAAFYGLATFEQMLDKGTTDLPTATFYDYSDKQYRGVIEGYYGYPYSISVKKDLFSYMMRYKMNTYLYGGKNDPYHKAQWKSPYPTSVTAEQEKNGTITQNMIKELTTRAHETKVNFIWAVHPGNEFLSSSTVVNDLMNKFGMMYNLGVRQFAIFVDDVGIPSTDAGYKTNADNLTAVQNKIEQKWNKATAAPADTVKPLFFVPQIYCRTFAGSEQQFNKFFQSLSSTPSHIAIFITGYGVWSVPNTSDCNMFRNQLGRGVGWWWNYPCNDNGRGKSDIYVKDMYANFVDMPNVNGSSTLGSTLNNNFGIICNPMQQGTASKIALFSAADYAWHHSTFNNIQSWNAAVKSVVGSEDASDFAFLADYLRYNNPSDFATLLNNSKTQIQNENSTAVKNLTARLERIESACERFIGYKTSTDESKRLLYQNMEPWLLKLQRMAQTAKGLMKVSQMSSTKEAAEKWDSYLPFINTTASFSSDKKYRVDVLGGWYDALPSGKDFPTYVSWIEENAMSKYFTRTLPDKPMIATNLTSTTGISVRQNTTTKAFYMTSRGVNLEPGDYAGICLPQATRLSSLTIGEEIFSKFALKYSSDGKNWTQLTAPDATPESYVKYLIAINEADAAQSLTSANATFNVVPMQPASISEVSVPSGDNAESMPLTNLTDGDYNTWWAVKKNQATGDTYMLTLDEVTPIFDVRICVGTTNDDFMNTARVEVSQNGKTWTAIKVKGTTNTTNFTMTLPQVTAYSSNMKYCDFDGLGREAKYVRLRVTSANTSKWLRLYEMEVNRHSLSQSVATLSDGSSLPMLSDGLAHTGIKPANSPIYYNFRQNYVVNTVYIYSDGLGNASVEVTEDGDTWEKLADIENAYQVVDVSAHPKAQSIRISWKGTAAPTFFEIEEETSDEVISPTGIGNIVINGKDINGKTNVIYDIQGRKVSQMNKGVYIIGGKKIIK